VHTKSALFLSNQLKELFEVDIPMILTFKMKVRLLVKTLNPSDSETIECDLS